VPERPPRRIPLVAGGLDRTGYIGPPMSRRIDIELTSDRGDGTWTWRAAGAKQPKGVVAASLLPEGSSTGEVLRAEVEVSLDGTDVVSVTPPKQKNRREVETLELISRPVKDDELVTSKLARKGRRDRDDDRPRGRGRDGERSGRDGRGRGDRDGRSRDGRGGRDGRPARDGDQRGRGERTEGGDRRTRTDRPRRERPAPPAKPKPKRLRAGRVHRKAALEALPAAEQVIAEQVLMGGLPAVRQAIDKQNEHARASGGREVAAAPLLAVAERLLPALRSAEWLDKAEAALNDIDELDLRDLRSVVVAAETGAKDDHSRELATQLREGLTRRVEAEQAAWLAELTSTLAEGRVVRALRLSSRPPKAGAPLPAELASRLAEAASAALTADTAADRWATVLDASSYSPVRTSVAPASKPEKPSEELLAIVTRMAERLPKVAEAFGIDAAAARKPRSRGGRHTGKKRPPIPPKPGAPTDAHGAAPNEAETEPASAPETVPEAEPEAAAAAVPSEAPALVAPDPTPEPEPIAETEHEPIAETEHEPIAETEPEPIAETNEAAVEPDRPEA
jgi:hypothetical protein